MKMKGVACIRLMLLVVLFCVPRLAGAHPTLFTSAQIYIQPDGKYQLFTSFDFLAFALQKTSLEIGDPPMNALLDGPSEILAKKLEESRIYFLANLKLQTDQGPGFIAHLQFTTLEDINQWKASGRKPRLPVVARVEVDGTLPDTASRFQIQFPVCMGTVVLTVNRPGDEAYDEPIDAGFVSSSIPIRLQRSVGTTSASQKTHASRGQVWLHYVQMGIKHIIPEGTDHICFILGLFLAGRRWSFLLWQVTAFTLAHSITLALSLYGVIQLPAYIVEPCIAASIIFIGIENLRGTEAGYRRLFVVFGFGLIHGLGFASAIRETGLPRRDFLGALIGFNIGVELGQLIVIAIAFLLVGWFRRSPHYRNGVIIPGSLLISLIATFWFFQRVLTYG